MSEERNQSYYREYGGSLGDLVRDIQDQVRGQTLNEDDAVA